MNDPTSPAEPDALDRRLDAALRRRFAVPPTLDTLAARARPRPRLRPWMALALAAGLLAGFLLWRGLGARPAPGAPRPRVAALPSTGAAQLPVDAPFCRLIGPLVDGLSEPARPRIPDLVRLYREMDVCQRDTSDAACGHADQLAERMSATYGQELELRPEAAGLLHGPFGSDEWPTGMIVTGTSDERTAVLVADLGSTIDCCVQVEDMPEGSGLRLFNLQVGDVVFTEITPFGEPRLLRYFE
jgi:hypothetical protein